MTALFGENKKFFLGVAALIVILAGAFFGARFAASYYYKKGTETYLQNNFAVAKNNFDISLIFGPKNSRAHFWLGKIALGQPAPNQNVYYPQADYKEAAKHYEKAILLGLEQNNENLYKVALDDLGNAFWNLNELDRAREKYFEKLSKFPDASFWARYFIAWHDFNYLNKPDEALEVLLPALNLASSDNDRFNLFKINLMLARLYIYKNDYASAVKYAESVIESGGPQNKSWEVQAAHGLLAIDYGRQKKFALAESEIKKANDLAESAGANNCILAAAYVAGENYPKAISVAEKIDMATQTYMNSVCVQILAISYLAKGDKINARKYLEEYLSFTEKFTEKNIFVMRNRQEFAEELLKLK
ncbi:MAG: hypothetical protein HYV51_01030 [Parcubacteria group bacterium]|nr:hypothetical protein [Parcubacteria group bacterium]